MWLCFGRISGCFACWPKHALDNLPPTCSRPFIKMGSRELMPLFHSVTKEQDGTCRYRSEWYGCVSIRAFEFERLSPLWRSFNFFENTYCWTKPTTASTAFWYSSTVTASLCCPNFNKWFLDPRSSIPRQQWWKFECSSLPNVSLMVTWAKRKRGTACGNFRGNDFTNSSPSFSYWH